MKDNNGIFKIIGIGATVVGAICTIVGSLADKKLLDSKIEKAVIKNMEQIKVKGK